MTAEQLLILPDWQRFSNRDLRRAIILAKVRARQTFALMLARLEEHGVTMPLASGDLYTSHCILPFPNGRKCNEEWEDRAIIDWCQDPRVYSFCTVYDQYYRRHQGIPKVPQNSPYLQARAGHACAKVDTLRNAFVVDNLCLPFVSSEKRLQLEKKIETNQKIFNAALDFSMLALMQINAYTDHLLGTSRSAQ